MIANGFQRWFTCELLSLEQQVHISADVPSSYLVLCLLHMAPVFVHQAAMCGGMPWRYLQ